MANDRYQYGTSPRKLQPEYKPTSKKHSNKNNIRKINTNEKSKNVEKVKASKKNRTKVIWYVAVGFVILFAISYRNSLVAENFAQIKELKNDLSVIQKENEQLRVVIESNLNLSNVEKEAINQLGMKKLTTDQTVYVNLPKQDHVEPATEELVIDEETGWLKTTFNKLFKK